MDRLKNKPIRIGQIDFVNVWPFFHELSNQSSLHFELIKGVPTQINRMMENGELDVAPVSSVAFAKNANEWMIIPDVSISAIREVKSILLLHKQPIHQWKKVKIALTNSSETSVALLKWLVSKLPAVEVSYEVMQPRKTMMLEHSDAALLIGDEALNYLLTADPDLLCTDLGEWWHRSTGHSMTYAVWVVRKALFSEREDEIHSFIQLLKTNKEKSLANLHLGVQFAQAKLGGSNEFWLDYFNKLIYDFHGQELVGLQSFYSACYEIGVINQIPNLILGKDILKMRVDA